MNPFSLSNAESSLKSPEPSGIVNCSSSAFACGAANWLLYEMYHARAPTAMIAMPIPTAIACFVFRKLNREGGVLDKS
jgi:hypothetical protein